MDPDNISSSSSSSSPSSSPVVSPPPSPPFTPPDYYCLPDDVVVHLIQDKFHCEKTVKELYHTLISSDDEYHVIGLDAEWESIGTNKVALLQIAVRRDCFLLHLHHMDELPSSLQTLLEDSRIIKVGVAIVGDARKILSSFGVLPRGLVDLRSIAHRHNYLGNGLAGLASSVVGVQLDKSHEVRCSRWESLDLTSKQIQYAATDAWIGKEIFDQVFSTYHEHTQENIVCGNICKKLFCEEYIDSYVVIKSREANGSGANSKKNGHLDTHPCRKSQLYDNCQMIAPTGEVLCKCDMKKVQWYMDRDLAELVSSEPVTIRLKFSPNGMGHAGEPYYMSAKENKCVGCGMQEKLLKHSVVPHCYRAYFPAHFKSRTSHDVSNLLHWLISLKENQDLVLNLIR